MEILGDERRMVEGKRNEEKEGEIGGVRREIRRNEMDKKN